MTDRSIAKSNKNLIAITVDDQKELPACAEDEKVCINGTCVKLNDTCRKYISRLNTEIKEEKNV